MSTDSGESPALEALIGQEVVLDMQGLYVYLGTLAGFDHRYCILENCDVHDLRETTTTRELYVYESRLHGIRPNRKQVLVSREQIVSLSPLKDVIA